MTNVTIGANQSIRDRIVLAFSVRAPKAGIVSTSNSPGERRKYAPRRGGLLCCRRATYGTTKAMYQSCFQNEGLDFCGESAGPGTVSGITKHTFCLTGVAAGPH